MLFGYSSEGNRSLKTQEGLIKTVEIQEIFLWRSTRDFLGKLIIVFSICIFGFGCATPKESLSGQDIMKAYLSKVNRTDGISVQEAVFLAQSQLVFRGYEKNYYLDRPKQIFESEKSFGIQFYPRLKTVQEAKDYPTVVVEVQKKDGQTRFHRDTQRAKIKTETIEYPDGDALLEGYLAYDQSIMKKRPGILVVHEWKGLGSYAKKRAEQLAAMGYVAFAVDMYGKGIRPETNEDAAKQAGIYKSDRPLMRQRVAAGLEVLKNNPLTDPARLAAIGYCFGGTTVLELARSGAEIRGVVSFHGGLETPLPEDAKNVKGKILVLHGADDPYVGPKEVEAFENEMKQSNVNYKLIKYPKAVHSFTNPDAGSDPSKGAAYNAQADTKSWAEMKNFLQKVLK